MGLPSGLISEITEADVVVYGGTASGIAAACKAVRLGQSGVRQA
jgi:ribulose 1,5-bisphosphate synthetase/thiazole synthase